MTFSSNASFAWVLDPYRQLIECKLQEHVEQLGPKNSLRDACEYALLNGGKRFRPALVLMIAKALGHGVDVSQAALSVEFFHTASLIADDLPCMDNDQERRNKPTLHLVYGESTALLATYALISAGYASLAQNAQLIRQSSHPFAHQSHDLCRLAIENASHNTGLWGATGGQFLDLNPSLHRPLPYLQELIHKKTGTLFEISFVLGWIFGGGELSQLDRVKKSALHFGRAFQIADDLGDQEQDLTRGSLNMANLLGEEKAQQIFHEEIDQFTQTLNELNLDRGDLQVMACLLANRLLA
jgi:geranylgeranyl diphosphate synthase, type II